MSEPAARDPKALIQAGLKKALTAQYPVAQSTVARLRRVHPNKTPAEMVAHLDAYYLNSVTVTGAGTGAAAIVPNFAVQLPVTLVDLLTFLEASVLYALTVAEVHGVDLEDHERRQLLVTAVLVGDSTATSVLRPLLGRTVPHWGKRIVKAIPMSVVNAANNVLGPRFITKWGTKQGVLVLGKQIPLAIGVVVGAGGNRTFAWLTTKAARKILGPPPAEWPKADEAASNGSRS